MQRDEAAEELARRVSESLARMLDPGLGCPSDADRFDWSSNVLDELARAVSTLAQVVDRLAGALADDDDDPTGADPAGVAQPPPGSIDGLARDLATAIVRQRNSLVAEGASRRRHDTALPALPHSRAV